MKTLLSSTLAALLLLASAPPLRAQGPPVRLEPTEAQVRKAVGETWYGVYMQNRKVGYLSESFFTRGEGTDSVWVSRMQAHLKIMSMGQKIEIRMDEEETFSRTAPYKLRGGYSKSTTGPSTKTVTATVMDGRITAVVDAGGQKVTMTRPAPDYRLADELTPELWVRAKPKKGERIRVRTFDLGDLEEDVETQEVTGIIETVTDGIATKVYEVRMEQDKGGSQGTARVDAGGKLLSVVLGGFAEARLEPKDLAMRSDYSSDLFIFGIARLDKPLGVDVKAVKTLTLEVTGKAAGELRSGPAQRLETAKDGRILLHIDPERTPGPAATEAEVAENLEETVTDPIRHETVRALAVKAVGDAASPQAKVERLVAFVDKYVEDSLGDNASSIFEIIKARKGDCTEHAMLFTALARCAGVPAREVGGLMYMGDKVGGFGGHAWAEVVLQGRWVPVDPTWNEVHINGAHIRLGEGRRSGDLQTYGRLGFRLIEVNGHRPARGVSAQHILALVRALGEAQSRAKAAKELIRIGLPALPALLAALRSGQDGRSIEAAKVLGRIRSKEAVPSLIDALHRPAVAPAAAEALKGITGVDLGEKPGPWEKWLEGR